MSPAGARTSFSRLLAFEACASHSLPALGCDVRVYDQQRAHPRVRELRELSKWSDGHAWVSPEQQGSQVIASGPSHHRPPVVQYITFFFLKKKTAIFKNQIRSTGSRSRRGRCGRRRDGTLVIAQGNRGSQSFNSVNSPRVLGRWMRMFTILSQSSTPPQ